MKHIPPSVLEVNSVFFKYLGQESPFHVPGTAYSGASVFSGAFSSSGTMNFHLDCSNLRTFAISNFSSADQVRVLKICPRLFFLEIRDIKMSTTTTTSRIVLQPVAWSLRDLGWSTRQLEELQGLA